MSLDVANVQKSAVILRQALMLSSYLDLGDKKKTVEELIDHHQQFVNDHNNHKKRLINITAVEKGQWIRTVRTWLKLEGRGDKDQKLRFTDFESWFLKDISVLNLDELMHNYLYLRRSSPHFHTKTPLEKAIIESIKIEVLQKYQTLKQNYETSK